jgi:hypothetical protein
MDVGMVMHLLHYPRGSDSYVASVERFIEFAFKDKPEGTKIRCPCQTCMHIMVQPRDEMLGHLVCNGILENYDQWFSQGDHSVQQTSSLEPNSHSEEMHVNINQLIEDVVGHMYDDKPMVDGQAPVKGPNLEAHQFYKQLEDSKKPLWL